MAKIILTEKEEMTIIILLPGEHALLVSAVVSTSVSTSPSLRLLQSTLCSSDDGEVPVEHKFAVHLFNNIGSWPFEGVFHPHLFHESDFSQIWSDG